MKKNYEVCMNPELAPMMCGLGGSTEGKRIRMISIKGNIFLVQMLSVITWK